MKKKSVLIAAILFVVMVAATVIAHKAGATFTGTFWALVPPLVAIVLALITKEVYSSLFIGIITGGLLYSGYAFEATIDHVYSDGLIYTLCDPDDGPYNVGILIFLVLLGIIVCLMNFRTEVLN